MWEFPDKFSFSISPKKFKSLTRSIFAPNIVSHGDNLMEFLETRKKNHAFVFFTINENLFTANQSLTSASSELIIEIGKSNLHH